ncbi:cytochrome P450 [Streptomyces sulfonofaciens]|uniref:Cytochrome P450 n=1 Tax=Streptomyces sulfonofaciens TaxID=68272 RepID=A0A919L5F8_9ACTN|nr:cytochrome P450 [Streptomyces sulfonofaciens]GHH83351.1 cytochrome P450 [Streptomyces sulfonofaciens]
MTETAAFPQDRSCPFHPPTAYRPLAEQRPLSRVALYDGREVWMVTGHAVARRLLADPRLSADRTNPAYPITTERFAKVSDRRMALIGVDDPEHGAQRRMLMSSFTLKRINTLRPRIQETVDRLLDAMAEKGAPVDLVTAFALPVASTVICVLLGVPYEDHEYFEWQSRRLLRGPRTEDLDSARDELHAYLGDLIDGKRQTSGEGLLDVLVAEQYSQGRVERRELISLATILLLAGHESAANMISLGVFTLLRHPERLAELKGEPSLTPAAVEELLRFLSVDDGTARVATEDIEIAGVTIRADDGVMFSTSVINRDRDIFEEPDSLDWHRPGRNHLAFGHGAHQCIGQNLARAEVEIALRTLFARMPDLRLAVPAGRIPFKPGDTLQGLIELPVTW